MTAMVYNQRGKMRRKEENLEIQIAAQGFTLNESIESFAQRKVERLARYLPQIADLRVELARQRTRQGNIASAQITLRHQRGAILRAEEKCAGNERQAMQAAINGAVDRMYRQISRFKGKRIDRHRRRNKFRATSEELSVAEALPAQWDDDTTPDEDAEIVRRKEIQVATMSELEAIDQMELLGHPFYLYRDEASKALCVLYRREADGYGVLQAVSRADENG